MSEMTFKGPHLRYSFSQTHKGRQKTRATGEEKTPIGDRAHP